MQASHGKGCKCVKSQCMRKYCECFAAGLACGATCTCVGCQNEHGARAAKHYQTMAAELSGNDKAGQASEKAMRQELANHAQRAGGGGLQDAVHGGGAPRGAHCGSVHLNHSGGAAHNQRAEASHTEAWQQRPPRRRHARKRANVAGAHPTGTLDNLVAAIDVVEAQNTPRGDHAPSSGHGRADGVALGAAACDTDTDAAAAADTDADVSDAPTPPIAAGTDAVLPLTAFERAFASTRGAADAAIRGGAVGVAVPPRGAPGAQASHVPTAQSQLMAASWAFLLPSADVLARCRTHLPDPTPAVPPWAAAGPRVTPDFGTPPPWWAPPPPPAPAHLSVAPTPAAAAMPAGMHPGLQAPPRLDLSAFAAHPAPEVAPDQRRLADGGEAARAHEPSGEPTSETAQLPWGPAENVPAAGRQQQQPHAGVAAKALPSRSQDVCAAQLLNTAQPHVREQKHDHNHTLAAAAGVAQIVSRHNVGGAAATQQQHFGDSQQRSETTPVTSAHFNPQTTSAAQPANAPLASPVWLDAPEVLSRICTSQAHDPSHSSACAPDCFRPLALCNQAGSSLLPPQAAAAHGVWPQHRMHNGPACAPPDAIPAHTHGPQQQPPPASLPRAGQDPLWQSAVQQPGSGMHALGAAVAAAPHQDDTSPRSFPLVQKVRVASSVPCGDCQVAFSLSQCSRLDTQRLPTGT